MRRLLVLVVLLSLVLTGCSDSKDRNKNLDRDLPRLEEPEKK
jgi:uncharacterized protein YcfL